MLGAATVAASKQKGNQDFTPTWGFTKEATARLCLRRQEKATARFFILVWLEGASKKAGYGAKVVP